MELKNKRRALIKPRLQRNEPDEELINRSIICVCIVKLQSDQAHPCK